MPVFAWRGVSALAAVVVVVQLGFSPEYGYHRDEFYFRMLGEHPSWGYVDQPPLTPLLARAAIAVFGDTVWAIRVPAALSAGVLVLLVGLLTRELGGGRGAQLLAAAGTATSAYALIVGHTLLTASLDVPVWVAAILFAVRALRRDPRWWLAVGATCGLALYNKHLVVLLGIGLVAGLALVGPREVFGSRWLWLGGALALLLGAPNVWYQASHDWPQFTMAEALRDNNGLENRLTFVPLQLVLFGAFLVPVWLAGWWALWRHQQRLRCFAVAYPVAAALVVASGGRPDYVFGLLILLYAAGCVRTVEWLNARRAEGAGRGPGLLLAGGLALHAAGNAVLMLPLVPVEELRHTPIPAINQVARDAVGWPTYVAQVAEVYHGLPAAARTRAVIVTANYGEAGALHRYRAEHRLPRVYSGQNELWFRARPPSGAAVAMVVGYPMRRLSPLFDTCAERARLDNGVAVENEEQGVPVIVCRDPVDPWPTTWRAFQHYD